LQGTQYYTTLRQNTARLVAVVVGALAGGVAAVGAVLGTLGLGGLATVQSVRIAGDLVVTAVVAGGHLGAAARHALVVLAVGHDGAGEAAVGVQTRRGTGAGAVVQVVGVLAQAVVAAVVAWKEVNIFKNKMCGWKGIKQNTVGE